MVGGGYTGQRFAECLRQLGADVVVTHRRPAAAAGELPFDSSTGLLPTAAELQGVSHLLVTAPPDRQGQDPCLSSLKPLLDGLPLQWAGYLSTTGVYGDQHGQWVDESTSPTADLLPRSQARLECEQDWLTSGWPVQVFRLPGIYGPGRNSLVTLQRGDARHVHKPGQVFCRVHVDDIVGALLHCLRLPAAKRPSIVNVCDNRPAPSSELLGYAAHLLGCPLPQLHWFEAVQDSMSPMALSFWRDNRRVSNRRLTKELGYSLMFPSYREGLQACLRAAALD
ncbi:MAG: SDR family oxidoreductase [Synechococcus sp.]